MVHQHWFVDNGSPIMVHQQWFTNTGSPIMVHQQWFTNNGSPIMVHQQWFTNTGSPTMVHQQWFTNTGSSTMVHRQMSTMEIVKFRNWIHEKYSSEIEVGWIKGILYYVGVLDTWRSYVNATSILEELLP